MKTESPKIIRRIFLECLRQANRKTTEELIDSLRNESGLLAKWRLLLLGSWWGFFIVPFSVFLIWALLGFVVRLFRQNFWIFLVWITIGVILPNIVSQFQLLIVNRPTRLVRFSQAICLYQQETGCSSEQALQNLREAILYYKKKNNLFFWFINFSPNFLLGCLTSGDLQTALFSLFLSIAVGSPDILGAVAEAFQANPLSIIIFCLYLAAWIWKSPEVLPIYWMELAIKDMGWSTDSDS
jgi:hypothetical protein